MNKWAAPASRWKWQGEIGQDSGYGRDWGQEVNRCNCSGTRDINR